MVFINALHRTQKCSTLDPKEACVKLYLLKWATCRRKATSRRPVISPDALPVTKVENLTNVEDDVEDVTSHGRFAKSVSLGTLLP